MEDGARGRTQPGCLWSATGLYGPQRRRQLTDSLILNKWHYWKERRPLAADPGRFGKEAETARVKGVRRMIPQLRLASSDARGMRSAPVMTANVFDVVLIPHGLPHLVQENRVRDEVTKTYFP